MPAGVGSEVVVPPGLCALVGGYQLLFGLGGDMLRKGTLVVDAPPIKTKGVHFSIHEGHQHVLKLRDGQRLEVRGGAAPDVEGRVQYGVCAKMDFGTGLEARHEIAAVSRSGYLQIGGLVHCGEEKIDRLRGSGGSFLHDPRLADLAPTFEKTCKWSKRGGVALRIFSRGCIV